MSLVLVDTSAWVEHDRATNSPTDRRLHELILAEGSIAVTDPVVMEVASGARTNEREQQLRRLLGRFRLLPFDPTVDFAGATRIYRRCRPAGITPRGLIDCMIASVAWRTGSRLLCHDADLVRIAEVIGIALDDASR